MASRLDNLLDRCILHLGGDPISDKWRARLFKGLRGADPGREHDSGTGNHFDPEVLTGESLAGVRGLGQAIIVFCDEQGGSAGGSVAVTDVLGRNGRGLQLGGLDLSGAQLVRADLRDSCFEDSDLSGANLTKADLRGTSISRANFGGANMMGASMRSLTGALVDFRRTNLFGVEFDLASFTDSTFLQSESTSAFWAGADLTRCHFDASMASRFDEEGVDTTSSSFYE